MKACSTRAGRMAAKERNRLPARAFGLPKTRAYPMFRMVAGKPLPDAEHAANAKARATEQLERGRLTKKQWAQITRKADKVLAMCGKEARQRKRSPSLSKLERACRAAVADCVKRGCSAAEIRAAVDRGCRGVR